MTMHYYEDVSPPEDSYWEHEMLEPLDEVDLDDVDIADLLCEFQPRCYTGNGEDGPCAPQEWIEQVHRMDCDRCGALNQRVVREFTVFPQDPTAAYELACGHTVI